MTEAAMHALESICRHAQIKRQANNGECCRACRGTGQRKVQKAEDEDEEDESGEDGLPLSPRKAACEGPPGSAFPTSPAFGSAGADIAPAAPRWLHRRAPKLLR
eukprot:3002786-Rhodomonas_salina.1